MPKTGARDGAVITASAAQSSRIRIKNEDADDAMIPNALLAAASCISLQAISPFVMTRNGHGEFACGWAKCTQTYRLHSDLLGHVGTAHGSVDPALGDMLVCQWNFKHKQCVFRYQVAYDVLQATKTWNNHLRKHCSTKRCNHCGACGDIFRAAHNRCCMPGTRIPIRLLKDKHRSSTSTRQHRMGSHSSSSLDDDEWEVKAIVEENKTHYKCDWAGVDAKGKPWPLSWTKKSFVSAALVAQWEGTKQAKARQNVDKVESLRSVRWRRRSSVAAQQAALEEEGISVTDQHCETLLGSCSLSSSGAGLKRPRESHVECICVGDADLEEEVRSCSPVLRAGTKRAKLLTPPLNFLQHQSIKNSHPVTGNDVNSSLHTALPELEPSLSLASASALSSSHSAQGTFLLPDEQFHAISMTLMSARLEKNAADTTYTACSRRFSVLARRYDPDARFAEAVVQDLQDNAMAVTSAGTDIEVEKAADIERALVDAKGILVDAYSRQLDASMRLAKLKKERDRLEAAFARSRAL